MDLLLLGGSALAVLLLMGLSVVWGFRGTPGLAGEAELAALAESLPRGFTVEAIGLDRQGAAALLASQDNRLAVAIPHGAHFIVRELDGSAQGVVDDDRLVLRDGQRRIALHLPGEAADWQRRIERLAKA